jgi:predicted ATP-grasp superfamily ATP-dependent carboligase
MIMVAPQTVLVLGTYRHSLTTIRSLSRAGHRVIAGLEEGRIPFGKHSRYTDEVWHHSTLEGNEAGFGEELERFFRTHPEVSLLLPMGDPETRFLAENRSAIPGHAKPLIPSPEVVALCHDKLEMCRIAEQLGIPQKPFHRAADFKELEQRANDLGYPCVIRPPNQFMSILGEKVFICDGPGRLKERFAHWPFSESPLLIQQFSPGLRHTYYFLAHQGELVAGVETKILRTDRANGTGFAVESISVEPADLVVLALRKFLRHFDYSGIGCIQFLMADDNRIDTFLEINPRLGAAHALSHTCGVDFPRIAVELALGETHGPVATPPDYATGVRFGWLHGDLLALQKALAAREITVTGAGLWLARLLRTFLRARSHPTWSLKDPMPTLFVYWNSFLSIFRP